MEEATGLPDGTVTFLFTDVEGSTRLFERHAEAYRAALLRHDAVLRAAIEGNRGHVFETVGDAFYGVFASPAGAVVAALRAQIDLAAEDWGELGAIRIRVGLHTGDVERRGRHYFGHTLYRCARIMATAHGGQVVMSTATADAVRGSLPEDASLKSLGVHRLKDLGEPEQIWQLTHPALREDFPPLKSLNTLLNNLPQQVSTFVGRDREMDEVRALVSRSRLVTLLGVGGAGKTRLALQVAADALDAYPDGVWFVDLAPVSDPALLSQAIASALGIREETGRPLAHTLTEHLRAKRLLLLLDNCEHVIEEAARIADAQLRACPHVTILATSRQALGIAGETTWQIPPLAEAVTLFVDRACAIDSTFCLTPDNTGAVAEICRRVDGIPLAIELAAARTRVLTPEQIAERLEERFALLTGGSRAALPRQRTLRALVDWSYDLLEPEERTFFDRLSVFAGGWMLEAAEAICSDRSIEAGAVVDLLGQLADKSLVVADARSGPGARYRLLETLREYGRERLEEYGEAGTFRARHAAFFLALAEQAEPELTGAKQTEWLERLETEHDNLRTAARTAIATGDAVTGWRLGGALYRFWSRHGYFSEGRARLDALIALPDPDPTDVSRAARAKALHGAATLAVQQGDHATARRLFEESLAIKRDIGDRSAIAATLNNLAVVSRYQGDHVAARAMSEEALALYRDLGDRWAIAMLLANLGNIARDLEDRRAARDLFEESLALRRDLGDKWGIANSLENLGHVQLEAGDLAGARGSYTESLSLGRELGDKRAIAFLVEDFGALAASQGEHVRALRLVAAGAALRAAIGAPLPPAEQARLDRFIGPARQATAADQRAAAEAEGSRLSIDEAVDLALLAPALEP